MLVIRFFYVLSANLSYFKAWWNCKFAKSTCKFAIYKGEGRKIFGRRVSDVLSAFSPGIFCNYDRRWILWYSPTEALRRTN